MVYPIPNYTRIKVRGHFVDLAKASREETSYGLTGPVQFIPTPIVAINQGSQQIIEMKPFVTFPDPVTGYFEILLPSTDDPDVVPQEWNYKVIEPTGRSYYIVVPYDTPFLADNTDPDYPGQVIDLVDVVPDPGSNAGTIQLLHGRPGRDITSVTFEPNGHLTGTYSDATSWDAGSILDLTGKVSKTGDTMTGILTLPALESVKVGAPANRTYIPDSTLLAQAPFAPLWHDILAFNRALGTPTFETFNGTTWTAGTRDDRLFSMKEFQSVEVANGTTVKGARWTWSSNVNWNAARWLLIGHAYSAVNSTKTVKIETSPDGGVTWIERHISTYQTTSQPVWHYVSDYQGDTRLRLTITHGSGGPINLSSVRLLSSRWGDQGRGREYEFPYTWNAGGSVGIGLGIVEPSATLHVVGDSIIQGKISNVVNPVAAQDAATKGYVDLGLGGKAGTNHTHTMVQVTDLAAALDAKANTSHTHGITDLTATGTKNDTTFLRGDNTWAQPPTGTGGGGVTDHGALTGLTDDDHTQYFNATRGDARYAPIAHTHTTANVTGLDTALAGKVSTSSTETIAGTKTFSSNVVVSNGAPTAVNHLTRKDYVDTGLTAKANTSHVHAATDLTSGTVDIARIPTGTTSTTAALGNHAHSGMVTSPDVTVIDVVTQAQYDALGTKVATTLYVVVG